MGDVQLINEFTETDDFTIDDILYALRAGASDRSMRARIAIENLIGERDGEARMNISLAASVAASALTISVKQLDGTDPDSGFGQIHVNFRSATATSGVRVARKITAPLSLVIPSGATIGFANGIPDSIYVYLIDNAGSLELAVSTEDLWSESLLWSTTIMNTSSDSRTVLYSGT